MKHHVINNVNKNEGLTGGRRHRHFYQTASRLAITAAFAAFSVNAALAQDGGSDFALEEIVVTAQKRAENMQDVPISINAIGASDLESLGVTNFEDFAAMIPSLAMASLGPGDSQVFMRGLNPGGISVSNGNMPPVGIYVDEQPVTTIGFTLDLHMYDIERVEALGGPQGTLYGASAQAGTVRIITKKPSLEGFEAGIDLTASNTRYGDSSYNVEGFVNIPVSDNAAIRLTAWNMRDGGYIDSVQSTRTYDTPRLNNALTPSGAMTVTNDAQFVKDDFNVEKNSGARLALKVDLNDNWTANARVMHQDQKTNGVWDHNTEEFDDLQVSRFMPDNSQDKFTQLSLVLEGEVAGMDLVYAGSHLSRDREAEMDYSSYALYSAVSAYYSCYQSWAYDYDANDVYLGGHYDFTDCIDPTQGARFDSSWTTETHEFRLSSDQEKRFRFIAGVFYQDQQQSFQDEWYTPELNQLTYWGGNGTKDVSNAVFRNPLVDLTGYSDDVTFVNDQHVSRKELAAFGEFTYDISDKLAATVGVRVFETKSHMGGVMGTFWWTAVPDGLSEFDVDANDKGELFKGNLTYRASDDLMLYATYSEGFRPAGANRDSNDAIGATYKADKVSNYEFGWKAALLDNRARFNGSVYIMDWTDIQLPFFNPAISLVQNVDNAGGARSKGIELDAAFAVTESLTISGSASYIDSTLTTTYTDPNQVVIPAGSRLPGTAKFKSFISARYDFEMAALPAFAQMSWNHVGSSYNALQYNAPGVVDLNSYLQGSYDTINVSVGVEAEGWGASLFANNLTDTRAELFKNEYTEPRTTTNRPRTIGVRLSKRF